MNATTTHATDIELPAVAPGGIRIATLATWPHHFTVFIHAHMVWASEIDRSAEVLIDALATACERQRERLRGTDYSTGYEPLEPVEVTGLAHLAAVRFDPRAIDAAEIRDAAPAILHALKSEVRRVAEASK